MWHRTQVYFGIKEEDWDEDDYFDDDGSAAHEDLESRYNERPNVRRLNPRRRSGADFDEIFSDEAVAAAPRRPRTAAPATPRRSNWWCRSRSTTRRRWPTS